MQLFKSLNCLKQLNLGLIIPRTIYSDMIFLQKASNVISLNFTRTWCSKFFLSMLNSCLKEQISAAVNWPGTVLWWVRRSKRRRWRWGLDTMYGKRTSFVHTHIAHHIIFRIDTQRTRASVKRLCCCGATSWVVWEVVLTKWNYPVATRSYV